MPPHYHILLPGDAGWAACGCFLRVCDMQNRRLCNPGGHQSPSSTSLRAASQSRSCSGSHYTRRRRSRPGHFNPQPSSQPNNVGDHPDGQPRGRTMARTPATRNRERPERRHAVNEVPENQGQDGQENTDEMAVVGVVTRILNEYGIVLDLPGRMTPDREAVARAEAQELLEQNAIPPPPVLRLSRPSSPSHSSLVNGILEQQDRRIAARNRRLHLNRPPPVAPPVAYARRFPITPTPQSPIVNGNVVLSPEIMTVPARPRPRHASLVTRGLGRVQATDGEPPIAPPWPPVADSGNQAGNEAVAPAVNIASNTRANVEIPTSTIQPNAREGNELPASPAGNTATGPNAATEEAATRPANGSGLRDMLGRTWTRMRRTNTSTAANGETPARTNLTRTRSLNAADAANGNVPDDTSEHSQTSQRSLLNQEWRWGGVYGGDLDHGYFQYF